MKIYTIGVYNKTDEEFFDKLVKNKIDTFCDIRQVRGMRGAKYSFVNSNRLQQILAALDINYVYVNALTPTEDVRDIQKAIDQKNGILQTNRVLLDKSFISAYEKKVFNKFNMKKFIEGLTKSGSKKIVFFCVEENHEACHRSIVCKKLQQMFGFEVAHL